MTGVAGNGPSRNSLVLAAIVAVVLSLGVARVAHAVAPASTDATAGSADPGAATTPGPTTTGPAGAAGSTTTTAPSDPAVVAAVDQAIAFVQKTRGLQFKTRPVVTVLADAAFVARLDAVIVRDAQADPAGTLGETTVDRAMGIIDPGATVTDTQRALGSGGVLGFYDPRTKELTVRAGSITPLARTVIVHELVHALDDQWFDLDRPEYDAELDEIGFGLAALAEGDARRVENAYVATLSAADQRAAQAEAQQLGGSLPATVPEVYLTLAQAPYTAGERLVRALLDKGGQALLDRSFPAPPRTSEQVLDPSRFIDREDRRAVPPPPADAAPVVSQGVLGQLVLQSVLEPVVGPDVAERAALGWAGDWYVAWQSGGSSCVRADVFLDTAADAADLATALDRWAGARPKARVEAAPGPSGVRFISCS